VVTSRVAKVLVLVTLIVTSCSLNRTSTHPSSTPSFSPGTIAWKDCGGSFQCGTLQVPLDYDHPSARTISLALLRVRARDSAKRIGSVLLNPGGPGESGIEFLRGDVKSLTGLNQRFDLVTWDPRGVAASTPAVTCIDNSGLDAFLSLDVVLDDAQEKQSAIQAMKDFAAGCEKRSGDVLPFMDTATNARDMDQIRIAVGDDKLTYLGFSYGTYMGEWYARLFPTKVRALALDGIVDPTVPANDSLLAQTVGFEQNLQAFLAYCRSSSSCGYGRRGDPGQKLLALMQRLDSNPIRVGGRELTRALAMTGVLLSLYDQSLWRYLDQALTAAQNGDGRILMVLADFYNHRQADGTYTNLFNGAYLSAYCLDWPVPADIADYDRLGTAFAKASALFGPFMQYGNLQCAYWPVKPKRQQGPLPVDGAPPILLVGGTNDPATPYAESVAVSKQIEGSVLLTRQGNGHTSYDSSSCAHAAEDAYLTELALPAAGTVCSS